MKKVLAGVVAACFVLSFAVAGMAEGAKLVASKNSDKYHLDTCSVAKKITADNQVTFATPEAAIKAGYSACKMCNPPTKTIAFIGSKGSDKYHTPECKIGAKIAKENLVTFASADDAKKAGYSPCQACCKTGK